MKTVYVETSILSYLTARPSRDLLASAHQQVTREWWDGQRGRFIDYLLTWNCRHIDNAETKPVVRTICATRGYACPEICTPEELMGEEHEG